MSKFDNTNSESTPFEKQINEINEWQTNATNPGHFISSGKAPLPIRNSLKSPFLIFLIGIVFSVVTYLSLKNDFTFENILNNMFTIIISAGFIFGGIYRLIKK